MKRILTFLLVLALLLLAAGCSASKIETPANFYYLKKNLDFTGENGVIAPEITDATQYQSLSYFLSTYLRGPQDPTLVSPFPSGTLLVSYNEIGDTLVITLSDRFASLAGIDLSLACCALAKTAIEFSGVSAVEIHALTEMLDGGKSITITQEDILLTDLVQETVSESQS